MVVVLVVVVEAKRKSARKRRRAEEEREQKRKKKKRKKRKRKKKKKEEEEKEEKAERRECVPYPPRENASLFILGVLVWPVCRIAARLFTNPSTTRLPELLGECSSALPFLQLSLNLLPLFHDPYHRPSCRTALVTVASDEHPSSPTRETLFETTTVFPLFP